MSTAVEATLPPSHPRSKRSSRYGAGRKQKRQLERVEKRCQRLVGDDPINTFADNCENTLTDWVLLLQKTTLPSNVTIPNPRIASAFKAVDSVLSGKEGGYLLRRLAYIRLMQIFSSLETIIKSERESGQVNRLPCYRASSVAMDLYINTQERCSSQEKLRCELKERKRSGRTWSDLAGPSPLLVLLYSEAAEPIGYANFPRPCMMYALIVRSKDFKKSDRATMNMVAAGIHKDCPVKMVVAATDLMAKVDSAISSGESLDLCQIAYRIKEYVRG